ncbi:MAG: Eco57I restriction-modification methylase domain-containing protein [Thiomonas delicata]
MDKQQAQQAIHELFTQPFDQTHYQHFLRNLLNQYEVRDGHYTGNYIPDAFKHHINQYWRIGKYVDPDGRELDLLVVEVKSLTKLERARSSLRNFAVNRLKQFEKEASLIAFYAQDDQGADWRFSFVKIEHEAYQDDKGKVKLKQELTPAKRYSYLVGVHENSHTASKQLLPLLQMDYADPRIEEIEAAFSIEKVTGEFFEQYKALFQKLAEHLKRQTWFSKDTEEESDQQVSRFAKKLLGQIVFLYFLQKKGWLGVAKDKAWGTGSKRFMRERHDQTIKAGGSYYRDFLQYLFYEALADERKGQADPGYYARFDCRVPFLNGGLFEADYDWRNEHIDIPNTLFHNDEKNKNGDLGTGILDVFDRYNFTIKEDEPLEKEVAVDPEMLGKVFENMLEVTERKSKGAFYTPREIVHYMCQESLIHYLDNRLNTYASTPALAEPLGDMFGNSVGQKSLGSTDVKVPKSDIETLIRKGHLALENDTRVLAKGKETDTYKFQLPESVRQHAKAFDTALADIKVCDPAIGSGAFPVGLLHEIVNARLALAPHSGINHSAYDLKRHAIGESLYGVDIDASAIDIARLRLWLSLIVDEEDYGKIEALPNLDYKIVRGDSLVGFPEDWKSPAFDKIEGLKKQFFEESDHDRKSELKNQIEREIQQRLADSKRVFGWQVDFDFRLFFSEVWHYKGGFDVVIGNPPFVSAMALKKLMAPARYRFLKSIFESAKGATDLYVLFFEKGLRILANNKSSTLSFISPNRYLSASYGESLREFIFKNWKILRIADYSDVRVFKEASTYPIVSFLAIGSPGKYEINVQKFDGTYRLIENRILSSEKLGFLDGYIWGWLLNDRLPLVEKIIKQSVPISKICKVNATSTAKEADEFHDLINENSGYKLINTGTIDRFCSTWGETELTDKKKRYLTPYLPDDGKNISKMRHALYASEKIIFAKIAIRTEAFYDKYGKYASVNTNCFHTFKSSVDARYVLAWANSSLFQYVFECFFEGLKMQGGYLLYSAPNLEKMFILESPEHQQSICELVDYLISLCGQKNKKLMVSYFDEIIDGIFYELYFADQIKTANKEILAHLGHLTPVTDAMSEEEKLAIIQREFDRLYDPRHPVRNHLETMDSVEVVRTVREALQRK